MTNTTLRVIKNTNLFDLYKKLLNSDDLVPDDSEKLLTIALHLLKDENKWARLLGYRIIVLCSNKTQNYFPLYDIALNYGYIPLIKILEKESDISNQITESFFGLLTSSFAENYRIKNGGRDIYMSAQQKELVENFENRRDKALAVIAPTSYGKSTLFTDYCRDNKEKNICIIVPTKALLTQTKRRILERLEPGDKRKIVTHSEMYNAEDENIIAVLTQERLLRLLEENSDLQFGTVFVDEAHNLLDKDKRNLLLAKVIIFLCHRNQNTAFKFLTPFLNDCESLRVEHTDFTLDSLKIDESLKTEKFILADFRPEQPSFEIYDQFFDEFLPNNPPSEETDAFTYIHTESARKNIVYLNKPSRVEKFSKEFIDANALSDIENPHIDKICNDIAEFLHENYFLINTIKKGIVYHHGSVPDIIKQYIEYIFSEEKSLKYIVTNSTLLEGVNIPAEKLFVLELKKGSRNLSASQFKNLVGRVCRLSELFDSSYPLKDALLMLEPKIYLVGIENFIHSTANMQNFIKLRTQAGKEIQDNKENVLLVNTDINAENEDEKKEADNYLTNLGINIGDRDSSDGKAKTEIGQKCFDHDVTEIDILRFEDAMQEDVKQIDGKINDEKKLIKIIVQIFIGRLQIVLDDKKGAYEKKRLKEDAAQDFYERLIRWRRENISFSQMIANFLKYYENQATRNPIVYAGKWGNRTRYDTPRGPEYYVDIRTKNKSERVNLAIVRITEEEDFLDYNILRYAEILFELEKIDYDFYMSIKYGTTDEKQILLIDNGINHSLAKLLLSEFEQYVIIEGQSVFIDPEVIPAMEKQNVNSILIFETKFHIRR